MSGATSETIYTGTVLPVIFNLRKGFHRSVPSGFLPADRLRDVPAAICFWQSDDRHAICSVSQKIDEIKIVSAQAADELLGIEDVDASFVFYYESDNVVAYSARSMGKLNVQIIMEKLGGGGHLTMAGAQTKGIDLEEGRARLLQAIDEYYDTLENKDEPKALTQSEPGPVQMVPEEVKEEKKA